MDMKNLTKLFVVAALAISMVACDNIYDANKSKEPVELKRLELEFKRLEFEREKFPFLVELCRESMKTGKGTNCHFGGAK